MQQREIAPQTYSSAVYQTSPGSSCRCPRLCVHTNPIINHALSSPHFEISMTRMLVSLDPTSSYGIRLAKERLLHFLIPPKRRFLALSFVMTCPRSQQHGWGGTSCPGRGESGRVRRQPTKGNQTSSGWDNAQISSLEPDSHALFFQERHWKHYVAASRARCWGLGTLCRGASRRYRQPASLQYTLARIQAAWHGPLRPVYVDLRCGGP